METTVTLPPRGAEGDEEVTLAAPSFRRISIDWEGNDGGDRGDGDGDDGDDGDDGEEFEFAVPASVSFEGIRPVSAEEIFSNGRIRSVYSLHDQALVFEGGELQRSESVGAAEKAVVGSALQKLAIEDRAATDPPSTSYSTASSDAADLEGISANSYCLWTPSSAPSPDMRRRSHSAGESKRWRLRDLVIGRSQSDGKKKFIFLESHHSSVEVAEKRNKERHDGKSEPPSKSPAAGEEKKKKGGVNRPGKALEMDMVTAHRVFYSKGAAAAGDRRRSYLPYRSNLVGFFPNSNGGAHPF
ncbi:unnamed protein product [Spirodela intermedia]|uniref:Uncharacterized protein n=1 Tax=Spirodela intermedia TaxID=51605 RepID=A0A7I8KX14_SPIIN|nr:unnamed protein product [Spirodela intermedia]